MKLLLHACCGPCACYPTKALVEQGADFTLLYYNPNIHPYKEFKHRLSALRELAEKQDYRLIIDKTYPLEECVKGMLEEPGIRCAFCYRMRLRYTAKYAADHGFTAFSTTLLYSPYQKHELIVQAAEAAANEFGVEFYYQDWRPYYQEGVDISLALGLYRQPYCGCVFSERDRYMEQKKPKTGAGAVQASVYTDAGDVEAESKHFVRITKNIIQLTKQDTILYK
ncbi:MAG: epoxyqueuosine reductase QueH [Acidaminococcaceae bacterium]|nr:epoxyqueuosine reductase QueH [Acidaminococcaceae bacterium]MBO6038673.1 epoxyqueuosine reductase QueH [Acidaminococcaceae bacterium]MBP5737098.1 epoxyqueuosine reductase QueH [Acidaminococcaceae bacterium]